MAISDKKRKALLKAQKRRLARPKSSFVPAKPLTMKHQERNRFTDMHPQVLATIESTIIEFWEDDSSLDDAATLATLESIITDRESTELTDKLGTRLKVAFDGFSHLNRSDWIDGLRAIYTSVKDRSDGRSGSRKYLSYAKKFVAKMKNVRRVSQ